MLKSILKKVGRTVQPLVVIFLTETTHNRNAT
jgi:hypothetical protein